MYRRSLLERSAVVLTVGLAGCLEGAGGDTTPSPEPMEPTDTPSPTPTATPQPTEPPTTTSGSDLTATPTETEAVTPTPTDTTSSPGSADQVVAVAPSGSLSFTPESFRITAGDTVEWTWDAGGHNVKPEATPDDADWTGTPGGEFETFGSGYTYTYAFEVPGTYEYYCAPHRSAGMTGAFTVE